MARNDVHPAEPLSTWQLVFPGDLNAGGVMFGGKVVALMDVTSAMCAGLWAGRPSVTVSIDAIQFRAPVRQGQMIEVTARLVYVGNTSCMVYCRVMAHSPMTRDACFTCDGYFTMACLNEHGRPVELPRLPLETEEQRRDWERAEKIRQNLLERKKIVEQ